MSSVGILVTDKSYSVVNLTTGLLCSFFLGHICFRKVYIEYVLYDWIYL